MATPYSIRNIAYPVTTSKAKLGCNIEDASGKWIAHATSVEMAEHLANLLNAHEYDLNDNG